MKCKYCGKEFVSFFSNVCPFCGKKNNASILDALFNNSKEETPEKVKKPVDPYDWNNSDNCSDREYMDDEDYDDFDN